ncbi:DoxX-like protein [Kribbella sp. VKM Ac-2571]|uniref:DoxX family protein n=1 Tax=Kribbella sp. VKM Ac-2571 TaxID=2512222 RepID=UPI00105DD54E|nr:DoxX family protein [Kribbella sp. VKM Ac-2571]TDO56769.1 DoxX-like protein [Kribbella sp. VKM Ac-2571]
MYVAYLATTLLAAALTGSAAVANLIGHDYPKAQADKVHVDHKWILPFGLLLGAGSIGLLAGLAVPPLGVLAATGLVLYFLLALTAHLRVHDHSLAPWALYFTTCAAALVTTIAYR